MITERMELNSRTDAETWAENYELSDEQAERLAAWIWKNNPKPGCTFSDHPLSTLADEDFWAIVDPREEEKKKRYYYAAHSYMGLNMAYSADCWRVARFDSLKERDAFIEANGYDGRQYVMEACTAKVARRILGCNPAEARQYDGPYVQRYWGRA